jgi:hypothetical protein
MTDSKTNEVVEAMERWGFRWQGHDHGTHERMEDGYWTPWHIAAAALSASAAEVEALRGAATDVADLVERLTDAVERETHDIGGEGSLTVLRLLGPAYDRLRAALTSPDGGRK